MSTKTRGQCRLCGKEYTGSGMSRHIQSCRKKSLPTVTGPDTEVFHLVAQSAGTPLYWMHLQAPLERTLSDLDSFLRTVWLECCGHLSSFQVGNIEYEYDDTNDIDDEPDEGDPFAGALDVLLGWEPQTLSMNVPLGDALEKGDRFTHIYDYGSSTRLDLRVVDCYVASGAQPSIQILARNNQPDFRCECGKPAAEFCLERAWAEDTSPFMCCECVADHECDDVHTSIDNSPRLGICAFEFGYEPESAQIGWTDTHRHLRAVTDSESNNATQNSDNVTRTSGGEIGEPGDGDDDVAAAIDAMPDGPLLQEALERLAETARSLPQDPGAHWIGGRRPNDTIGIEEIEATPDVVLWIDPDRDLLMGMEFLPVETDPDHFNSVGDEVLALVVEHLSQTMSAPAVGVPSRPSSIAVSSDRLAGLLQAALEPLGVDVLSLEREGDLVSLLDHVLADFFANMTTPSSILTLRSLEKKAVRLGFRAAADFYRVEPWELLTDADPIEITLGEDTYYAVVMGSEDITTGLALYHNLGTIIDIMTGQFTDDEPEDAPDVVPVLLFSEREEVDPEEIDVIAGAKLEIASDEAYPQFVKSVADGHLLPLRESEFETLIACVKAVTAWVQTYETQIAEIQETEEEGGFAEEMVANVPVRTERFLTARIRYPTLLEPGSD